ncbi:MAG: hypothetical protein U0T36_04090 [Saprospiraceae bacterium]
MEIPHEVNAIKFYEGSVLKFKSRQFYEWQVKTIDRILFDEKMKLLFSDGMLEMSEITHVQMVNGTAKGIGKLYRVWWWMVTIRWNSSYYKEK